MGFNKIKKPIKMNKPIPTKIDDSQKPRNNQINIKLRNKIEVTPEYKANERQTYIVTALVYDKNDFVEGVRLQKLNCEPNELGVLEINFQPQTSKSVNE